MKKIRKGALCCILLLAIIISSIPMNKEIIKASSDSYLSVRGVDLSSIIAFEKSGQKYWQILPICPTSYGDSPYQSFSSFAGNPYFIDLDLLCVEQSL